MITVGSCLNLFGYLLFVAMICCFVWFGFELCVLCYWGLCFWYWLCLLTVLIAGCCWFDVCVCFV